MNIDIYTDGGAFRDKKFAAWSFIIPGFNPTDLCQCKNTYISKSGLLPESTNNGAEIIAVAFALEFISNSRLAGVNSVTIYSDCDRPVDALNGLLDRWADNGWKTLSPSKKRKNAVGLRGLSEKDKWVFLYAQVKLLERLGLTVKAVKVPSHTGVFWNEKCDKIVKYELAVAASLSELRQA